MLIFFTRSYTAFTVFSSPCCAYDWLLIMWWNMCAPKALAESEAQRAEEESNTETALLGNPLLNLAAGGGGGSEKVRRQTTVAGRENNCECGHTGISTRHCLSVIDCVCCHCLSCDTLWLHMLWGLWFAIYIKPQLAFPVLAVCRKLHTSSTT